AEPPPGRAVGRSCGMLEPGTAAAEGAAAPAAHGASTPRLGGGRPRRSAGRAGGDPRRRDGDVFSEEERPATVCAEAMA
ncbi:hypothetical protein, partial [Actinomadura rubrobrunea]